MLPFLKPKNVPNLIISKRKPDGAGVEAEHASGDENHALDACAEDLIRAIHAKDAKGVSAALKAAHEICESYEDESDEPMESDEA